MATPLGAGRHVTMPIAPAGVRPAGSGTTVVAAVTDRIASVARVTARRAGPRVDGHSPVVDRSPVVDPRLGGVRSRVVGPSRATGRAGRTAARPATVRSPGVARVVSGRTAVPVAAAAGSRVAGLSPVAVRRVDARSPVTGRAGRTVVPAETAPSPVAPRAGSGRTAARAAVAAARRVDARSPVTGRAGRTVAPAETAPSRLALRAGSGRTAARAAVAFARRVVVRSPVTGRAGRTVAPAETAPSPVAPRAASPRSAVPLLVVVRSPVTAPAGRTAALIVRPVRPTARPGRTAVPPVVRPTGTTRPAARPARSCRSGPTSASSTPRSARPCVVSTRATPTPSAATWSPPAVCSTTTRNSPSSTPAPPATAPPGWHRSVKPWVSLPTTPVTSPRLPASCAPTPG